MSVVGFLLASAQFRVRNLSHRQPLPVCSVPPTHRPDLDRPRLEPELQVDRRPWGRFHLLAYNEQVTVKILNLEAGARLSLQRHQTRDEWWHILDDGLVIEIDGESRHMAAGDRAWVPRGVTHRISNGTSSEARFLELAFGHFDEADIERLDDDYGRDKRGTHRPAPTLTVVVPSFNERDNVAPLVRRLETALVGTSAEILYVDDSTDDTAEVVRRLATTSKTPLRVIHREQPTGGLAGAVRDGLRGAQGTYVVVMDGDLQHPPELVPLLLRRAQHESANVVVASRYCSSGQASGLTSPRRRFVSTACTLLTRTWFPRRVGRVCSDPLSGFFCVRRDTLDTERLRPRGFKVLLEILARHDLTVTEVPFTFAARQAGQSKASCRNGIHFVLQLVGLRLQTTFGSRLHPGQRAN